MITATVQRWRDASPRYRPAGETIRTDSYDVAAIADDATARAFVTGHHYSRSYPAARFRFGLYTGGDLVGVAVFSVPVNDAALACLPGTGLERVELGRFVLLDSVPGNGESWFIARAFELLRNEGLRGVLSMSDPEPRRGVGGDVIFPGHVGTIYQATNAAYLGRATPRTLHVLPDGTIVNARALQKIRSREKGWRYAAALLERQGAAPLTDTEDSTAWLRAWLPRVARTMRHRGNHRYAWALQRADRRALPASLPYPKVVSA